MKWRERRGKFDSGSEDRQIDYLILPKRNGDFFVKAYLGGGAEHKLPFQDFPTAQAAMDWVEEYEAKRAERDAYYAKEEPIRL